MGIHTGHDFYAITAGKQGSYNAMIGSGGGLGTYMQKTATWCLLRSDRYTLELMEREGTYSLSYFPDEYKKRALFLASDTGRGGSKMKETELTCIRTPSGRISFAEARLILECKLLVLTTVYPDELYAQEAKSYVKEEYKEESHYRKIAFGEITCAWQRSV